jgi:hypothetical protein
MTGDLVHPGSELAVVSVSVPVLEHAEENLLDQVFTELLVSAQANEEIVETLVISFEQVP